MEGVKWLLPEQGVRWEAWWIDVGHEWMIGPVPGMCAEDTIYVVLQRPDGPRRRLRPVVSARDRRGWGGRVSIMGNGITSCQLCITTTAIHCLRLGIRRFIALSPNHRDHAPNKIRPSLITFRTSPPHHIIAPLQIREKIKIDGRNPTCSISVQSLIQHHPITHIQIPRKPRCFSLSGAVYIISGESIPGPLFNKVHTPFFLHKKTVQKKEPFPTTFR
jgi:hypothetical protein